MARQTSEKPLTPKQLKAARLQASGLNQRQTAEAVGVTRRAVEQWNSRKGYRDAVTSFMGTVSFSSRTAQLPLPEPVAHPSDIALEHPSDLLSSALKTVQECLEGEYKMSDKLKAAAMIFDLSGIQPKRLEESSSTDVISSDKVAAYCYQELISIIGCSNSSQKERVAALKQLSFILGLGRDFNTLLIALRDFGLNIVQDREGQFVMIDERANPSKLQP